MADFMGRVRSFRLTAAFGKLLEATSILIKKAVSTNLRIYRKGIQRFSQRNTRYLIHKD
jgi:hypothetical protein